MNTEVKQKILEKIESYQKIILTRHKRPDGDCTGATMGLQRILQLTYPEKQILLINEDYSSYVSFLGEEDKAISDEEYADALVIVIDTGNVERISNTKYNLGKEIIKIDHHIDIAPYGDISWVEDWRGSACEMIVDFYVTFADKLKMDKRAATCIYTGMITDTGRFKFGTTPETFRLAAVLLEQDIDVETLFAHLNLEDYEYILFKAYVYGKIKRTENGVAYIFVDLKMQEKFGLTKEQAANVVSCMDSIKGSLIWLAFIEYEDGSIRTRLRSRFLAINELAEKYRGGGHACAAGGNLKNKKEIKFLVADADKLLKEYKETHDNWL